MCMTGELCHLKKTDRLKKNKNQYVLDYRLTKAADYSLQKIM